LRHNLRLCAPPWRRIEAPASASCEDRLKRHNLNMKKNLSIGRLLCSAPVVIAVLSAVLQAGCISTKPGVSGEQVSVKSPDGTIEMTIRGNGPLTYAISVDGNTVLADSSLGLKFKDGVTLGANARLNKVEQSQSDTTWENKLGKRSTVRDHHNELRASFVEESGRPFEIVVRAFDDGIGFRYVLPKAPAAATQDFVLAEEQTQFSFPDNYLCYAGTNENTGSPQNPIGYIGSQESEYRPMHLGDLPTDQVRLLPLLVRTPAAWVAITESDLCDWAGLWVNRVRATGNAGAVTLAARLSPRPDGQGLVKSTFPRQLPWRTFIIARQPGQLIESDLVLNLASPSKLADTSWIKPGIASWDWWSQVTRPGTAAYKEFIQFSADMGWPYALLDSGWSSRTNIMQVSPSVNLDELLAFAKEKNVRLWLWLHWTGVDRNDAYREAFPLYEKWGIAGVKIDFMNRDDQGMVNWYEKIVQSAAEHHLMVNFHGAFKPTGMIRTYPNQITREGILGNEYNRWSSRVTPEHKVTLPFTRLLAGPADFTPGGFLNKSLDEFRFNVRPTQVQGTRCAELALFVCLESPVINACDHPSHYKDQPGLDFLKIVPTVWDDTRALDGVVGEHVVIARRNGSRWFLGALTDHNARDIPVKLDFLGPGSWTLKLWKDAHDSDTDGEHLVTEQRVVTAADVLPLHLARAGGAVASFEPTSR
jgi:alpha-glucosidase